MTHDFKVGVFYLHKNFGKCRYVGMGGMYNAPIFEYSAKGLDGDYNTVSYIYDSATIIGLYEDEPEQIDVANMWVAIQDNGKGLNILGPYKNKPDRGTGLYPDLAIVPITEWYAMTRGERKLIKGEGL